MTKFFEDTFRGNTLDITKWNLGMPNDPSGSFSGWPGADDQWVDGNVIVNNGLYLKLALGGTTDGSKYSAAMINSYDRMHIMGGWIQAQLSLPPGNGIWPAFWLLPASYPGSNKVQNWEIDMEYLGNSNTVYFTLHRNNAQIAQWTVKNNFLWQSHDYTFNWAPGKFLQFYFDGHLVGQTFNNVPDEPMFMIASIDSGGWNNNRIDGSTNLPAIALYNYIVVESN